MTAIDKTTVLFDLDGTLLDTAPDLAAALNAVRARRGNPPLDYPVVRSVVSHGSFAMTRIACDHEQGSADFEAFRLELLDAYHDNLATHTTLFDGMAELLDDFDERGVRWGIVTNKPAWLTMPLLATLNLATRAATVVSGDTLPERKPHPAPLLLAAREAATTPQDCVYIGDAERDIIAGNAAGMRTMVALYGYLGKDDQPEQWGADILVDTPHKIAAWLRS